jgi:glycosyltransferase involved in cell wall biosynthesis
MKTSAVDSSASINPRRLKIAVLNRVFSPIGGGAERYSIALVEQLSARHEVHVFAQEIGHQWPGVQYHQIPVWFKKPRWLNQLWYAYATWRATHQGFDIVHSHENVWHGNVHTMHVKTVQRSLLGDAAQKLSGPALFMRRLKIVLSPRLSTYLYLERARLANDPSMAVVAASTPLQTELVAQYPHLANAISTITPGVNAVAVRMSIADARRTLDVPDDGPYIAFIANDYARKGLPTLLAALQNLPQARLLVAGHAGQVGRFKALAQSLGVAQRVYFLGPLADVSPVYCAANVLAHPTLEDAFAMVVLEAMAHGVPVVVSRAPYCGISALLAEGKNAVLLAQPQDAAVLCTALQSVLNDPAAADSLAQQGMAFARQHTWDTAARAYEAVYYRLCAIS